MTATNYYMLVASLPHMPRTFEVEQVPISRMRLQQRLAMLREEDKIVVEQVQSFLLWDRQHPERTDEEVQREHERLMKIITNKLVRDIIGHRMDVRTITSALRRRRLGLAPPSAVGQYVEHIRKHWDHLDFRMARDHPWIPVFRRLSGIRLRRSRTRIAAIYIGNNERTSSDWPAAWDYRRRNMGRRDARSRAWRTNTYGNGRGYRSVQQRRRVFRSEPACKHTYRNSTSVAHGSRSTLGGNVGCLSKWHAAV